MFGDFFQLFKPSVAASSPGPSLPDTFTETGPRWSGQIWSQKTNLKRPTDQGNDIVIENGKKSFSVLKSYTINFPCSSMWPDTNYSDLCRLLSSDPCCNYVLEDNSPIHNQKESFLLYLCKNRSDGTEWSLLARPSFSN